ncbi:MAG: iron-sulfur cluster assembly accessory protein [Candidatus Zixiibacteriota bacterium]
MSDQKINTNALDETIYLTPAAVSEVKRLINEEKDADNMMLRVGVQGGGCSGLSYAMSFDNIVDEFDQVLEFDGLKVVVDAKSLLYMSGTTIDYTKELLTGGFKFDNPKSSRGCSCGTSFSV